MIYALTDLNTWPLRTNGEPILNNTNEAFLYAQFIHDHFPRQAKLIRCKRATYRTLKKLRESTNPDFDLMMHLACRAQFFRECLEECQRIKEENLNH